MFNLLKKNNNHENRLYNKILSLSRNKLFYTKYCLSDTFQNRINLIFLHLSFIFIKLKLQRDSLVYKDFYQTMFDFSFRKIELNMREIGHGDMTVNKNMKFLVKSFYNILFFCENYKVKKKEYKTTFFNEYLKSNIKQKGPNYDNLINYFHDFQTFCFDLSSDSVLKGKIKFKFN